VDLTDNQDLKGKQDHLDLMAILEFKEHLVLQEDQVRLEIPGHKEIQVRKVLKDHQDHQDL
jgi:hypothetical protein